MVWVDYEVYFTADEQQAKAAFEYIKSQDDDNYDYPPDEFELEPGIEDGTWVISYGCESWDQGPCDLLNEKFPDLKAVADVVGEHYD
jgi:hypothetical protein